MWYSNSCLGKMCLALNGHCLKSLGLKFWKTDGSREREVTRSPVCILWGGIAAVFVVDGEQGRTDTLWVRPDPPKSPFRTAFQQRKRRTNRVCCCAASTCRGQSSSVYVDRKLCPLLRILFNNDERCFVFSRKTGPIGKNWLITWFKPQVTCRESWLWYPMTPRPTAAF